MRMEIVYISPFHLANQFRLILYLLFDISCTKYGLLHEITVQGFAHKFARQSRHEQILSSSQCSFLLLRNQAVSIPVPSVFQYLLQWRNVPRTIQYSQKGPSTVPSEKQTRLWLFVLTDPNEPLLTVTLSAAVYLEIHEPLVSSFKASRPCGKIFVSFLHHSSFIKCWTK